MSENLKTRSLSRQLIITIILFSSLITLILTAIQLYLEYHRDTGAIDARLQQVESSYQRSIENAIWDLDKKQVQIQIDGIRELPDIEYAEITTDGGLFLSSGTKTPSEKIRVRQYDLSHMQENTNYPLGELTVVANLQGAYDRLLNRLGTVLLSNALKTFLVALFITFLLKRRVIRHLENVSTFLSQLGANKLDQQFNLNRKKPQNGQRDELDILENSVNQLRSNLAHSLSDLQAAEKRYRWLLRNSDEFIYRIGFKKPIPVNLPVNDQIQLILERGFAAEWNDALNNKLGYADDQLAKMKINDLHPLFDKDNLQSMQNFIESGYRINDSEVHVPDINGEIFTVLMNLSGVIENDHLVYIWGQDTDITERLKAQQKLQANLEYLQQLDAISKTLAISNKPDERILDTLKLVLELFDADRAWLLYPNDPESVSYQIPLEATHPDYPGAYESSAILPMNPLVSEMMTTVLTDDHPIAFEPPHPFLQEETVQLYGVQSQLVISIQPKEGQAWMLGLHQCRKARHWTEADKKLFSEIANRMSDPLGNYIYHQELQSSETRLTDAQKIAHVGYWDHDILNDKTLWSDESYRIYGYEPQSFIPDTKFFQSIVHPDDHDQVMAAFDVAIKEPAAMEFRIIRPDGTHRFISGTAQVTKTDKGKPVRLFGVIKDVTESKEKELQRQNSEARLAEAQKAAHLGHWEYDTNTKIVVWSDELFRIIGYEPQSSTPSMIRFAKMIHPDDRGKAILIASKIVNKPLTNEFRIIRSDGIHRIVSGTAWNSEDDSRQPGRVFGIVQDITDRKQLEERNRDQELQLIQADKMSSLGLLVSGVAHEINNPNNLIKINASMLEEMWRDIKPVLDKYQVENSSFLIGGLPYEDAIESILDMITGQADASQRIERIIDDLKNFARRGDNQNIVKFSINEAIESAVRLLRPLTKTKTDYLQLDLADNLPNVAGDLQHVEQIVINLLSNALDALPNKKHKVWISSLFDDESHHIQIRIKDNGVGIPNSDLKKIFDPFFTTKQETGGTGLGLAIAYNLTKENGGHLSCFSMIDEGTIFTISFPIAND